MSTLQAIKREVYGCAVKTGVMGTTNLVNPKVLRDWEHKFYKCPVPEFNPSPRLVNHFKIGADPEFVFEIPGLGDLRLDGTRDGRRIEARALGMKTGLFMGADQNGRLAELRPKPSKSCLKVLASLLAEMRWGLHAYGPKLQDASWRCNPFMFADGLGGHIHFGRKRPTRPQEVDALSALYDAVFKFSLYESKEQAMRQKGDALGQKYGLPDDYRPQAHGYEYRAFPSWLDNPWLSYFMLVTAKLAVHDPALVRAWHRLETPNPAVLGNLLAYYKGRDDDAWLAYYALREHGMPRHIGGDFRKRWGLNYPALKKFDIKAWPGAIEADLETERECFNTLLHKVPLAPRTPCITWKPSKPPEGYAMLLEHTDTYRKKGLGEIVYDLCSCTTQPCQIEVADAGFLHVSESLAATLPFGWKKTLQKLGGPGTKVNVMGPGKVSIMIGKTWREANKMPLTRKILTCGVFPLWKVSEVTAESYPVWRNRVGQVTDKTRGTMIYPRLVQ